MLARQAEKDGENHGLSVIVLTGLHRRPSAGPASKFMCVTI
jgi:hypothetical protein